MAKSQGSEFILNFTMGGLSAAISKTATAPIERVKLVLQTQDSIKNLPPDRKYRGIVDCFARLYKEEGVVSLWRGNFANVVRYFPQQALGFALKERFKAIVGKVLGKPNPRQEFGKFLFSNVLSGGLAGSTSLFFVYPLDFARTRLGTDLGKEKNTRQFTGIMDCVSKIISSDGLSGLYRGFVISALAYFIYRALYFGVYDSSKVLLGESPSVPLKFLVAQVVVTVSGIVTYPFDTVRRRLMMQSGKAAHEIQYSSTVDAFSKIHTKEGLPGFFKGAASNIFRGVGGSIVLVLYDELRLLLDPQAKLSASE